MTSGYRISGFAIAALVLLRIVIGWHFFCEGMAKYTNPKFSSEPFLLMAKGPMADMYHGYAEGEHRWRKYLDSPRAASEPWSEEEQEKFTEWKADYAKLAKEAKNKVVDKKNKLEALRKELQAEQRKLSGEKKDLKAINKKLDENKAQVIAAKDAIRNVKIPVELPPVAIYQPWGDEIVGDWGKKVKAFNTAAGLDEEQRKQTADILNTKTQELYDYLEEVSGDIKTYRHILYRLDVKKNSPEAKGGLPFLVERNAAKVDQRIAIETEVLNSTPKDWTSTVKKLETLLQRHLHNVLEEELPKGKEGAINSALDQPVPKIAFINCTVTWLTLGCGILLMIGFFTRTAATVAGMFLLSVIISQPPWVTGSLFNPYTIVEFFALLVIFATAAGQWAGLDFFTRVFFSRCCRKS